MDDEAVMKMLTDFARIAKSKNIMRVNILMHAWTIWSAGRIVSDDILKILDAYDNA
jgi:hypothetical protein